MTQRIVKPVFWPMLVVSSILLAAMMYFLIGGMLSNRLEDIFIAAIVGFILFLAAKTVQGNVTEPPKLAIAMMFFWPVIAVPALVLMINSLWNLDGGVEQVFNYLSEILRIRSEELVVPDSLSRSFLLACGIISAIAFIAVQTVTCLLLFVGTKPKDKDFRH